MRTTNEPHHITNDVHIAATVGRLLANREQQELYAIASRLGIGRADSYSSGNNEIICRIAEAVVTKLLEEDTLLQRIYDLLKLEGP